MPVRATSWRMRTLRQVMARFRIRIVLERSILRMAFLVLGAREGVIVLLAAVLLLLVLQAREVLDPLRKRLAPRSICSQSVSCVAKRLLISHARVRGGKLEVRDKTYLAAAVRRPLR